MLCELAKQDLTALRACGHSPTDEEIIALNDIALQIERGKDATPLNCPRVAFAGNVVLHEPTIGQIIWWDTYGRDVFPSIDRSMRLLCFSLAYATDLDYLNSLKDIKTIKKEFFKWEKALETTDEDLLRALMFAKFGSEGMAHTKEDESQTSKSCYSIWNTVIIAAGFLGMSPDELKTQTESDLFKSLQVASKLSNIPLKKSVAEQYIQYKSLLRKIEERDGQ